MPAPPEIVELVERFARNQEMYRAPSYNETQVRREFIDPMFAALGWDVDNRQGYAEAYKDVIHEDAIKVGGVTKSPDYCFRTGGRRIFFLEGKKPSVNIKEHIESAYQLRRYAWSGNLPLSILTDFEEFAVYDCRIKPVATDKASVARILYLKYTDYVERWDEIANVFSREAVLKGSFDKHAHATKNKKGTAEVDTAFLQDIEHWRDLLAKNFAARNPDLSNRDLNFAVQRTIDRVIFLRMCEDRGVEDYGQLQTLLNGEAAYHRLCELFRRADERYNSGLFHFEREPDRIEPPDDLTTSLELDDKPLKEILRQLYYPESPYEFSVLPAEILGQVYEQFLGKVIRLTAGHRAVVEDKPEVKKAGGVYYTPTYIVDYIVQQTVGKLLENSTPKQAAKLRILDPACGSGSFLIGAYRFLLDWHRDWYVSAGPTKHTKEIYQGKGAQWYLTTAEKKRILLNNIYGVDIDAQAVEVTKLSLLLKVLEHENRESLERQRRLLHERALPDLGNNIKCGNSLIGSDFYNGHQRQMFDEDEQYRINAFDWEAEFPKILTAKDGGFDVLIGNPPYGADVPTFDAKYLLSKFVVGHSDLDTYTLFMEQGVRLSKSGGRMAMIVPTGWYSGPKFSKLRQFMSCATAPQNFVNLPYDIFKAWVDTTVFVVEKRNQPIKWPVRESSTVTLKTFPKRYKISALDEFSVGSTSLDFSEWFQSGGDEFLTYANSAATALLQKLLKLSQPLSDFADVQRGVTPFQLTKKPTHKTSRPAFAGTVRRYELTMGDKKYIRFDQTLAEPKPEKYFAGPRLLLRELISRKFRLQIVFTDVDIVTNKSMQTILSRDDGPSLYYLLGVLNSRLLSWFFLIRSNIAQRDDFPKIVLRETRALPIHPIDLTKNVIAKRHNELVENVKQMLALQQSTTTRMSPDAEIRLKRQINALDRQIDQLVYKLYDLTDDEIAIVEAATEDAKAKQPDDD